MQKLVPWAVALSPLLLQLPGPSTFSPHPAAHPLPTDASTAVSTPQLPATSRQRVFASSIVCSQLRPTSRSSREIRARAAPAPMKSAKSGSPTLCRASELGGVSNSGGAYRERRYRVGGMIQLEDVALPGMVDSSGGIRTCRVVGGWWDVELGSQDLVGYKAAKQRQLKLWPPSCGRP